jgi:hypothetical protein
MQTGSPTRAPLVRTVSVVTTGLGRVSEEAGSGALVRAAAEAGALTRAIDIAMAAATRAPRDRFIRLPLEAATS